tara:strand:+ start:858 stop:1799 length:942 start_codon:yes stop_codon:yes gene_type:complete
MASSEKVKCMECGNEFANDAALHRHIKVHGKTVAEYYTTYYPRINRLTGDPLPFKNKADYFGMDFSTRMQMLKWCNTHKDKKEVKEYILRQLKNRIEKNKLEYGPNHLEIELNKLPPIDLYKNNFGGYGQACKELGLEPIYNKGITQNFFRKKNSIEEIPIYIDSREQKPLRFKKSKSHKLDFGDYTMGGDHYSYTFVDRKSEGDFKGTMTVGLSRFKRELERARQFSAFLYIVTESSIEKIKKNNNFGPHRSNLSYIWHNMRVLTHEFKGHCQFLFTGTRTNSQSIVPKLLYYGQDLWDVDLQYFFDHHELE